MKNDFEIELIKKRIPIGKNYSNINFYLTEEEYIYLNKNIIDESLNEDIMISNIIEKIFNACIKNHKNVYNSTISFPGSVRGIYFPASLLNFSLFKIYFLVIKNVKRIFVYNVGIEKIELFKKNFKELFIGINTKYTFFKDDNKRKLHYYPLLYINDTLSKILLAVFKNFCYYNLFKKLEYIINGNRNIHPTLEYNLEIDFESLNTYKNISAVKIFIDHPFKNKDGFEFNISFDMIHKITPIKKFYYRPPNTNYLSPNDIEILISAPHSDELSIKHKTCGINNIDLQIKILQILKTVKQNDEVKKIILELIQKRNTFTISYREYFNNMYNEIKENGISSYIVKRKYNEEILLENIFELFQQII